ncbi:DUF6477 family protein [Thalassorhabdomicrobium marinisediminis]|uniref:DUF6477 family protein n=1 Tax=Thalassorhabdomicrobium marinisediminis TaxID=2170577 RepID=UPI00249129DD|nr:DUF6477 family protein [Thalassorhabdomicrobium marinisediminis]
MEDILTRVSRLNRPKLLVRTARHGLDDYNRVVHLRRLLKVMTPPGPREAVVRLMELEEQAETQRQTGRGEYSVARHVDLITALMCEVRILKQATRQSARRAPMLEVIPTSLS